MTNSPEDKPVEAVARQKPRINGFMLLALLMLAIYIINYRPDIATIACDDTVLATNPSVIMLGTWWCPYCAKARRYFHDEEISYCEYDIERTAKGQSMYEEVDGRGIPVLIIGDRYKINGYDENAIDQALELLESETPP